MKTFKDIYKFPLHLADLGSWVWDADGNFVFEFEIPNKAERELILFVLNEEEATMNHNLEFYHEDGEIKERTKGKTVMTIRGWGNLTGTGTHNLPEKEAANIQDTFAEYIVERLNAKSQ